MTSNHFKSLLPRTSSRLERALEQACAERCEAMGLNIHDLYDADRCPLELLPFLAWAFHAPSWSSTWTEQQKRYAIKDAVIINRRKGTGWAVRMALKTANITAELVEWWQETPKTQPYTFTTRVWLNNQLPSVFSDIATYARLIEIVEEYKNVRSSYQLKIGAKFTAALGVALASSMHGTQNNKVSAKPVTLRPCEASLAVATSASLHGTQHSLAKTKPIAIRQAKIRINPAHIFMQFRATMSLTLGVAL